MTNDRDLESECWNAHDDAEKVGDRLKALDLLVKIRLAGERVKPDDQVMSQDTSVEDALRAINEEQAP